MYALLSLRRSGVGLTLPCCSSSGSGDSRACCGASICGGIRSRCFPT